MSVGRSDEYRCLNRFRNITACMTLWICMCSNMVIHNILYIDDDCRIVLEPITGIPDYQHDYINASYVDVSLVICLCVSQ